MTTKPISIENPHNNYSNPTKTEVGKINIYILDDINKQLEKPRIQPVENHQDRHRLVHSHNSQKVKVLSSLT